MKEALSKIIPLFVVCLIASAGLAFTYSATHEKILLEQQREQREAAAKAIPQATEFERLKNLNEAKQKFEELDLVLKATKDGKLIGYAIQVLPRGFGGPIRLMVGVDTEGKVIGLQVVEHLETPGLGGEIEEETFRGQFKGKTSEDALKVGEDIEAITGATISSRGVAEGVKTAVMVYKDFLSEMEK
jgi:electron transport complex protein RnfG